MLRDNLEPDERERVRLMPASLQRVYYMCSRGLTSATARPEDTEDMVVDDGWLNAAAIAVAQYTASDTESIVLTVAQLGDTLRLAYWRGLGAEPAAWDSLPARERLAWEMVARHAAWLTQADEDDLSRLGAHELVWPDKLIEHARNRGLTLEHPAAAAAR